MSILGNIEVTADSGAVDTVGPRGIASKFAIIPSVMSKKGQVYQYANGEAVHND